MSVNQRMKELGSRRSCIRELFEYSNARKQEIGEENVFDFSIGNPNIPAPTEVTDAMIRLLKEKNPVDLHGYTSAAGDAEVRKKISRHIEKTFGAPSDHSLIYLTCGASAALSVTLSALCNAGDEVIVFAPYFPEYLVFIAKAGATPVCVNYNAPDFSVDFEAFSRAITQKTKAVIFNSPCNPTGRIFTAQEVKKTCDILSERSKKYSSLVYLISDEPYREIAYDGVEVPYLPLFYEHTIVCYSYSKTLSLAGERIGYIAVSPRTENAQEVFHAVCGAGRALGYVCAPSILQYTVAECLAVASDIAAYRHNRDILYDFLRATGYSCVRPDGAFYLFVQSLEEDAKAFCERAKKYELILVPGDDFGCKGYVRISYCVARSVIEKSLPAFKALYEEYRAETNPEQKTN